MFGFLKQKGKTNNLNVNELSKTPTVFTDAKEGIKGVIDKFKLTAEARDFYDVMSGILPKGENVMKITSNIYSILGVTDNEFWKEVIRKSVLQSISISLRGSRKTISAFLDKLNDNFSINSDPILKEMMIYTVILGAIPEYNVNKSTGRYREFTKNTTIGDCLKNSGNFPEKTLMSVYGGIKQEILFRYSMLSFGQRDKYIEIINSVHKGDLQYGFNALGDRYLDKMIDNISMSCVFRTQDDTSFSKLSELIIDNSINFKPNSQSIIKNAKISMIKYYEDIGMRIAALFLMTPSDKYATAFTKKRYDEFLVKGTKSLLEVISNNQKHSYVSDGGLFMSKVVPVGLDKSNFYSRLLRGCDKISMDDIKEVFNGEIHNGVLTINKDGNESISSFNDGVIIDFLSSIGSDIFSGSRAGAANRNVKPIGITFKEKIFSIMYHKYKDFLYSEYSDENIFKKRVEGINKAIIENIMKGKDENIFSAKDVIKIFRKI